MIDKNFNLKLIDFDIAKIYEKGVLENEYIGTDLYICPEAHKGFPYDLEKNDVFACGVFLFIIITGTPPFHCKALKTDPIYKYFVEKKENIYWKSI